MKSSRLRFVAPVLPFLLAAPGVAWAQTPPTQAEANAALNPVAPHYTRQQLDQMLAPVALYPDQLLFEMLMAATYPQQVLDAANWLQDQDHAALKGDALAQALEPLPWDPGVKSLAAFPQIIEMMADHIEWTQALGMAFAAEQAEIMNRIQALRHLAMKSGKLKSVRHLTVREEGSYIEITSAESDRIYVPVYNPVVVYGSEWPDRDYPPVYLPPPQGFVAETIEPGIEVSIGYSVVAPLWGWSRPDWRDHRITVERSEYTRITRDAQVPADNVWRHAGPVVEVTNAPRRNAAAAQVPAGTIDPAGIARPGRAALERNAAPSNTASGPGTQANQPNGERNANNPAERRQTNTAPPGGTANEPAKPGVAATHPATPTPPAANAARQEENARPGAHEAPAPGTEHANAPAANGPPGREHPAPAAAQEPPRGPEREANRPNAPAAPHEAEHRPPAAQPAPGPAAPAHEAEQHAPPHQPAPGPAPAQAAHPPGLAPQPAQGSSRPPGAAPQPPKPAPGPHPPGHEDEQKEH